VTAREQRGQLIMNTPLELVRANKYNMEMNEYIIYLKGFYLRNLLVAVAKSLKISDAESYDMTSKASLMGYCNNDSDLLIKLLRHVDNNVYNAYNKTLSRMRTYKILGLCAPIAGWIWLFRHRRTISSQNVNPMAMLVAKDKLRQAGIDTDDILQKFAYDLKDGYDECIKFSQKLGISLVSRPTTCLYY